MYACVCVCAHAYPLCVYVAGSYIINRNFRDTAFSLSGHETLSSEGCKPRQDATCVEA